MDAKQVVDKMVGAGYKTINIWPRGEIPLAEWAKTAKGDWNTDTVHGCVIPREGDAYTAYYGTLWCSKEE